jgi:NADPH2:quinone reductase
MTKLRAVVVDPSAIGRLKLETVEPPIPLPHESIVSVHAVSVNRGEIRRAQNANAGDRIGWDFAGTVDRSAADGSGFAVGTRVVGFLATGAWSESIAVPTTSLAAIPDDISMEVASTLPIAGLTALFALEKAGSILGKNVLITGASGGVGHLACQLARASGAIVTAQVRRPEQAAFALASGAHQVVFGNALNPDQFFDLVLDSVGDRLLTTAIKQLAKDGVLVTFGATAGQESTLDIASFYGKGGLNLYGFILFHEVLKNPINLGLTRLLSLIQQGVLTPHIDRSVPWDQVGNVAQELNDRVFSGKAVLCVRDD